ncbi:MAG TPA: hypothetical protein VNJ52_00055 [Patescibacteria group bacterium]|nr:hypothetical protein [Patescibacteria group bacterium]
MIPELQALAQRVEDLEKQVAHLAALAVEHSDTDQTLAARTVTARAFVVTDARGARRTELIAGTADGQAAEQPWLSLFDSEGNVVVGLGVDGEGVPELRMSDATGKSVLNAMTDEHGSQIRLFYGGRSGPGVSVKMSDDGPTLGLFDANGRQGVLVGLANRCPTLCLNDAAGKIRALVTLDKEGWPSVMLCDQDGKADLEFSANSEGPGLRLGKDNKVIWSAP